MQRYYQRLYDSDRAVATNQFSKAGPEGWTARTNSAAPALPNDDGTGFVTSPFNAVRDTQVFRSARPNVFSDIFGSDTDSSSLSPESVRLKAEQKAHMDDFKELWNIDQPPATPVSASTASSSGSGPVFGTPQGSPSTFTAVALPENGSLQARPTAVQPSMNAGRVAAPPRADFAPPQRPF
jgi:hypothetical protein